MKLLKRNDNVKPDSIFNRLFGTLLTDHKIVVCVELWYIFVAIVVGHHR